MRFSSPYLGPFYLLRLTNISGSAGPSRATTLYVSGEAILLEAQEEFLLAITGEKGRPEIVTDACRWYLGFLENKIREAWVSLIRDLLANIDPLPDFPSPQDVSIAFNFLAAVVKYFKKADLALVQIVDKLYNNGILRYTDADQSRANQLVFTAFGWISTLDLRKSNKKTANRRKAFCTVLSRTQNQTIYKSSISWDQIQ